MARTRSKTHFSNAQVTQTLARKAPAAEPPSGKVGKVTPYFSYNEMQKIVEKGDEIRVMEVDGRRVSFTRSKSTLTLQLDDDGNLLISTHPDSWRFGKGRLNTYEYARRLLMDSGKWFYAFPEDVIMVPGHYPSEVHFHKDDV